MTVNRFGINEHLNWIFAFLGSVKFIKMFLVIFLPGSARLRLARDFKINIILETERERKGD